MQYDFFLSHYQSTGGDQVMTLELRLSAMGFHCWLDQNAATITKESMEDGVRGSKVFLLFLSQGVLTRPFCLFEIQTAMGERKALMLMHETDAVSFPAYSPYLSLVAFFMSSSFLMYSCSVVGSVIHPLIFVSF